MNEYSIEIRSATKKYHVSMVTDLQKIQALTEQSETFFVVDKNVFHLYNALFQNISKENLYLLDAVETKKNIQTALYICERIMVLSAKRNVHLVSFGGGITQDITGFVANILYRGIHWIFIPTTLLAACDSCIGGKTSLNYKEYKNLIGTFFPPDEILIYTPFFTTLTQCDFLSGLGEVVKFNLIQDDATLTKLETSIPDLLSGQQKMIDQFVLSSLKFKRHFIEIDEFDRAERIKLNFAHTFGHAYEVASGYKIPHGMAVSLGVVTANYISMKRGILSQQLVQRMESILHNVIQIEDGILPFDIDVILSAVHKDKKQINHHITAVLLNNDFELQVVHDISANEVKEAVSYLLSYL